MNQIGIEDLAHAVNTERPETVGVDHVVEAIGNGRIKDGEVAVTGLWTHFQATALEHGAVYQPGALLPSLGENADHVRKVLDQLNLNGNYTPTDRLVRATRALVAGLRLLNEAQAEFQSHDKQTPPTQITEPLRFNRRNNRGKTTTKYTTTIVGFSVGPVLETPEEIYETEN